MKSTLILLIIITAMPYAYAQNEVLHGGVQQNDALTRLSRPNFNTGTGQTNSLRLNRPMVGASSPYSGIIDTSQFSQPLNGNVQGSLGLVRPNDFSSLSPQKFDLGADRGSKELVIAWERWYKQLSAAIYSAWSQVANVPGRAIVRLTVGKDRSLNAVMIRSSGNPIFDSGLIAAILSLDHNPGLSFPGQSQRQSVTLESTYMAGSNIDPGYSWIRNDYEKVNESY